jgi:hypothetical protein
MTHSNNTIGVLTVSMKHNVSIGGRHMIASGEIWKIGVGLFKSSIKAVMRPPLIMVRKR